MIHKCDIMPFGIMIERKKLTSYMVNNPYPYQWLLCGYNISPQFFYCPYCGKHLKEIAEVPHDTKI